MTYKTRLVEGEGGLGKQKGGFKAARVQNPALGRRGQGRHLDRAGAQHHAFERAELPVAKLHLPPRPRPSRPTLRTPRCARRDGGWHSPEDRRQGLRGLRPRVAPLPARLAGRPAGHHHPGPYLPGEDPLTCGTSLLSSCISPWKKRKLCTPYWKTVSKAASKTHASNALTGS